MKLIIKNNFELVEYNFFSVYITTNHYQYSIYPNHQDLVLNLIQAKIEIIHENNMSSLLFYDIDGILFLKNDIIELIIY